MIADQELEEHGDEYRLLTHFNTDDEQRLNWEMLQHSGKGFIRDEHGVVSGRLVANGSDAGDELRLGLPELQP